MENILRDRLSMLAALGAGVVVGISGIYLYYKVNRCVTQELSHLTGTIESLRREIEELKAATQKGREKRGGTSPEKKKTSGQSSASASRYFTGYTSSLEDNDDEYYDFTDTEEVIGVWASMNGPVCNSYSTPEEQDSYFQELDNLLDSDSSDKESLYQMMCTRKEKYSGNFEFLWRLAKATHLYGIVMQNRGDTEKKKDLAFEALSYSKEAYELNNNHPEIHKWYAITVGHLGDFLGAQERIVNGYTFKEHVDKAIALKPTDPSLHYMLGRWSFEVASLSWIERKLASTLFTDPPQSSLEEARIHLFEADKLKPDWKENLLFIAKTYISEGDYSKAIAVIDRAVKLPVIREDDEISQKELEALQFKYQTYRTVEENGEQVEE